MIKQTKVCYMSVSVALRFDGFIFCIVGRPSLSLLPLLSPLGLLEQRIKVGVLQPGFGRLRVSVSV